MGLALTIVAVAVLCALIVLAAPAITNRPREGWSRWARAEAAAARRQRREQESRQAARNAMDIPVGRIFSLEPPEEPIPGPVVRAASTRRRVHPSTRHARRA